MVNEMAEVGCLLRSMAAFSDVELKVDETPLGGRRWCCRLRLSEYNRSNPLLPGQDGWVMLQAELGPCAKAEDVVQALVGAVWQSAGVRTSQAVHNSRHLDPTTLAAWVRFRLALSSAADRPATMVAILTADTRHDLIAPVLLDWMLEHAPEVDGWDRRDYDAVMRRLCAPVGCA